MTIWFRIAAAGGCLLWTIAAAPAAELPAFAAVDPPPESVSDAKPLKLERVSDRANRVADEDSWWASNALESPFLTVPNPLSGEPGALPPGIPATAGGHLAIVAGRSGDDGRMFAVYGPDFSTGSQLALFGPGGSVAEHALDFSAWFPSNFRIRWAQVRDDTLYFSYGINGYASEAGGRTGYLAAVDLRSRRALWRSDPLVANARNFLIRGNSIVSGYGFTDEPDFLYVVDRATGRTTSRVGVASAPEIILPGGDRIHVRCYNRDYVFREVR